MRYEISGGCLQLQVDSHGAEPVELHRKGEENRPLLWDASPEVWARHAPEVFPWCGRFEDNWFAFEGRRFTGLPQHGFARDLEHTLTAQGPDVLEFRLDWTGDAVLWPWSFSLTTRHTLRDNVMETVCTATCTDSRPMPVQMGFHPALRCPFTPGRTPQDYVIRFEQPEAPDGTRIFPLEREVFDHDSICFPGLRSGWVQVEEKETGAWLRIDTAGYPFVLLWSRPGIPGFVCIEPWTGYPGPGHDPAARPGVQMLAPGASLTCVQRLTVGL